MLIQEPAFSQEGNSCLYLWSCSWDRTTARITFMTTESQKELSIPLL